MPYKRNDSPIYWASYTDPSGKRVRRSTGTTDRKEAAAIEAKWKLEAFKQTTWNEQPDRSFEELMSAYLRETSTKRSHDKDLQRTRTLRLFFGGQSINAITPADVRRYAAERRSQGIGPATINRETALMSAAINHANREWDWSLDNPFTGRRLKEPEGRVRWLSREEADRLIKIAGQIQRSPHLADFIRLALMTGCRSQELLGMEWARVDFEQGLMLLEAEHSKTKKRRSVPLNDSARATLLNLARYRDRHCPESRWVFPLPSGKRQGSVQKAFQSACERAGIVNFRIHDLRHTCAAWLVSAGVPLAEVRDLLGHASIVMTERYAHLAPERVRAAVSVLAVEVSRFGHADTQTASGKVVKFKLTA